MKKLLTFLIVALILGGIGFYAYIKLSAVNEGEIAPEIEATLVDGSSFTLSDLKGSYVLLDFWGSWCLPCRRENPQLVQLHSEYGDKVTIVTIALEKDRASGIQASISDGFTWKYQVIEETTFVLMSETARKYGVTEIPHKVLIDPEGRITHATTFEEIYAELEIKP